MGKHNNRYIFVAEQPSRRKHRGLLRFFLFIAAIVLSLFLANFIINHQVQMRQTKLTVQTLHGDLQNFSILLISDLQGKTLGPDQNAISSAIGTLNCSCIIFAGDMVGTDGDPEPFLQLVRKLPEGITKLYLPGDSDPPLTDATAHGSLSAYADWAQRIVEAGVQILDEPVMMTRGKGNIWFVPEYLYNLDLDSLAQAYQGQLDSLSTLTVLTADQAAQRRVAQYQIDRIERIRQAKAAITAKDVQVAVSHIPLSEDYISTVFEWNEKGDLFSLRNVSLILAGHYCAGSIRLPGFGAVHVEDLGWFPDDRLLVGLSNLRGIPQFITRGLDAAGGEFWQSFRFMNQPQIDMIYLTSRIV